MKPRVERKEYVVPLIRKNVWRLPQRSGSGGQGKEEGGKSEEEIALEREAAEAIMRGQWGRESSLLLCMCYQFLPWLTYMCKQA